jgi:hypothetical protein
MRKTAGMKDKRVQHQVEVAGHVVGRGPIRVEGNHLVVMFTVSGPEASPRFPKEHVVMIRPGDPEKLNSRGGYGGQDDERSAFFEWRFDWPGGLQSKLSMWKDATRSCTGSTSRSEPHSHAAVGSEHPTMPQTGCAVLAPRHGRSDGTLRACRLWIGACKIVHRSPR